MRPVPSAARPVPRRTGLPQLGHWLCDRGTAGDQTAPGDQTVPVRAAPGETMTAGMQLAIALLTADLDSPELEAWAADALTPRDVDGLADFMADLHMVSVLLDELHEATGEPSAAALQRLAILAEHRRGTPSAGQGSPAAWPSPAAGCPARSQYQPPAVRIQPSHRRGMRRGLVARAGLPAADGEPSLPPIRVSR
jgi:hypothetical protein